MKLGLIVESGPQGADKAVCERLAHRLASEKGIGGLAIRTTTSVNKPQMIEACGISAKLLLSQGCERVAIVWDLYPAWAGGAKPCLKTDREKIHTSLNAAQVPLDKVVLIAIERELESWLLADGNAIQAHLDRPTRKCPSVPDVKHPDHRATPKDALDQIFREHGGRAYSDATDAIKLAENCALKKLRRSVTFARYEAKLFP